MSALQEFRFNQKEINVLMIDDNPWWIASQVCSVLGLVWKGSDSIGHLEKDEKSVWLVQTKGGTQQKYIINESGLYTLIMRSDKPEAKAFRKWVTSEVLPQIRKTGNYSVNVPRTLPEALRAYANEVEEHYKSKAMIEMQKSIIEVQQPKVDAWGEFLDCDGLIDLGYVAQVCKTGKNRLFEILRNAGVFYYQGKFNAIKQEYKNRGYFDIRFKPNKKLGNIPTIKCTPKGAEWIYTKFYRKEAA